MTLSDLSNRPTLGINQHPKATRVSELDSIVLAILIIGGGGGGARNFEDQRSSSTARYPSFVI